MKNTDHCSVHGSVHLRGERKLYGAQRLRKARRIILDAGKKTGLYRVCEIAVPASIDANKKGESMSVINKPPELVKRQYELEDPVAQAVDKYALFIQSTPDHVVNSALKMVIWKDAEFRRWRKQQQSNPERKDVATSAQAAKA